MAKRSRKSGSSDRFYFLGPLNHCGWWLQPWNLRHLLLGWKTMLKLYSILKSRDIILLTAIRIVKAKVFFSGHVRMWELDHKQGWVPKNCCFWFVLLEKTPESTMDCKEMKLVIPKGNRPWIFIGRMDAEAEVQVFCLATWCEDLAHWKRHWCWERLKAGGEGDNRGWDGWMASLTQWTWVNFGRWWRTGRPGVLRFRGSQRVGHDWATELSWGLL